MRAVTNGHRLARFDSSHFWSIHKPANPLFPQPTTDERSGSTKLQTEGQSIFVLAHLTGSIRDSASWKAFRGSRGIALKAGETALDVNVRLANVTSGAALDKRHSCCQAEPIHMAPRLNVVQPVQNDLQRRPKSCVGAGDLLLTVEIQRVG